MFVIDCRKGDNIYLRTIEPTDADLLLEWENNSTNWRVSNTMVPFSKELIKQYVTSAQDLFAIRQIRFMICGNNSKKAIGTIDLFDYEPIHQRAGVGILMEHAYRGKGLALEALKLVNIYAFKIVGIRNLHASIMSDNDASIHLFEKAGYRKIGERNNWYNVQGDWVDESLYQKELLK